MTIKMKSSTEKKKGQATPVDKLVGAQLRQRRSLLGWSQEQLAQKVDITFQQIQKYENGANRISASRLYEFSKIMDIPISFFFKNSDAQDIDVKQNEANAFGLTSSVMENKETLELVRSYYAVEDKKLRKDFMRLLKSMVKN